MKSLDFSGFENRRYRTLYVLLPLGNGVLLAACYLILHSVTGIPDGWITTRPDIEIPLAHEVGSIVFWSAIVILPMIGIGCLDLIVVSMVYDFDFMAFIKNLWRLPPTSMAVDAAILVSALLTSIGSAVTAILASTIIDLPDPHPLLRFILYFTFFPMIIGPALARVYAPAMISGEEALHAAE